MVFKIENLRKFSIQTKMSAITKIEILDMRLLNDDILEVAFLNHGSEFYYLEDIEKLIAILRRSKQNVCHYNCGKLQCYLDMVKRIKRAQKNIQDF